MSALLRILFPIRFPAIVEPVRHAYTPLQIKLFAAGMAGSNGR